MGDLGAATVLMAAAFAASLLFSTYQLYRRRLAKLPLDESSSSASNSISLRHRRPSLETDESDRTAEALFELAWVIFDQRDFAQATSLFRQALAIWEEAEGPADLDVARALQGLGASVRMLGEFAEAELLLRRALAIRERALCPEHPAVATALQELGWLAFDRGNRREASALFRRALAIREQVQGAEHLDVANALQGLGASLRLLGEIAEAEPLLRRALAIRERALGPECPSGEFLNHMNHL